MPKHFFTTSLKEIPKFNKAFNTYRPTGDNYVLLGLCEGQFLAIYIAFIFLENRKRICDKGV